jgi:3-oxoacyl-[acyl-carrier protein] reductase
MAIRLRADAMRVVALDLVPGEADAHGIEWRELDVRDRAAVDATLTELASDHGTLDVLVNNAGIQRHGSLAELSWETWSSVIDVNLHGVFNCLQAAGRIMLDAGGGAIVNITSIGAERGASGRAPYTASKAAVIALTRSASVEWATRRVRVNAVGPGYVDTGLFREAAASGALDPETILARIPARRLALPEEVAAAVSFLVSDGAAYITGQTLFVDGGFLAEYGVPVRDRSSGE